MKISGLILLLIIITAFAVILYRPAEKPAAYFHTADDESYFYKDTLGNLTRENRRLKNKIIELEQANRTLRAQAEKVANHQPVNVEHPATALPLSPPSSAPQFEEMQAAAEMASEFTTYLTQFNSESENLPTDLANKFETEAIDYPWASSHEQKLGKLFESQEELVRFVPEGIICKTTRCQIKIPISSFDESNQLMKALAQALTENTLGIDNAMLLTAPDPASGFVDFYIGRDKNTKIYR